ncbi:BRN3 transcription factor [Saccoglossus kowalevskii]|uniref:POU domain protein n=1 Tax=Saccoglossus kowalevskii TaxID=10224 RepID=D1LWX4_SACKO|nr:BRN3 transcription factor [Saccoglossus kowalevskii]ACY92480.1 BRN3 transcription factor [Saccoglossus kowalevskii]
MMMQKDHVSMHPPIPAAPKYSPLHRHDHSSEMMRRHCMATTTSNIFGGLDDSLLARAEALAAVDAVSVAKGAPGLNFKNDTGYHHHMNGSNHHPHLSAPTSRSIHPGLDHGELLGDPMSMAISMSNPMPFTSIGDSITTMAQHHQSHVSMSGHHHHVMAAPHSMMTHGMTDLDTDPRELEAFAEHFKQRRIKLGVTQCDVGSALGNLKLPGVGSLSQSTICRFESLTLSHNNMIALKPILSAWLEEAEKAAKSKDKNPDIFSNGEKKRKRTSIAAPEKRSLEAYFAVQPRPSSEKIAAIAEKLDLKKNVVRVWFCNQRQKQKRMKFSAQGR